MEMEFTASSTDHHHQSPSSNIIRGKRTKRPRPSSPPSVPVTSSSSTGGSSSGGGGGYNLAIHSLTTSSTDHHREISAGSTTTEEEEDMANCLIMLATQTVDSPAIKSDHSHHQKKEKPISSRKFTDMVMPTTTTTAADGKVGFYVYECKTCNRTFSSFQALGGHRASHKKPKTNIADDTKKPLKPTPLMEFSHEAEERKLKQVEEAKILSTAMNSPASPPPHPPPPGFGLNANKAKVHECSICGSEFLSGQALGGHMRRHRTFAPVISPVMIEKPKSSGIMLSLDLNLPAPPEDHDANNHHHRETNFQFTPNSSHLIFSAAPALIDCHY